MVLKSVVSRSFMSRVSRRRVLRDVSQQGSLGEPRRKRKERERKESKTSLGEMERDVRDVEKGMEQGRTSGARSNDGDAWHTDGTGDGAFSHSPQIPHHTPHHKPSFLATSPDTSGTRDQRPVPQHTPFGEHAPCAEALWKPRRRVIVPFPSDATQTPIHKDPTSKESVTSSIPQHTTRDIRSSHSSRVLQANGQTRPRDVIDRVVPCCLQNQNARGSQSESEGVEDGQHCLQHNGE